MKTKLPHLRRRLVGHREDGTPVYSRARLRDWVVALVAGGRAYVLNVPMTGIGLGPDARDVFLFNNQITPGMENGLPPKGFTGKER